HVRATAWSRRTTAVLDTSDGDTDTVWSIVRRLAFVLPADITLVVAIPREDTPGTTVARLRSSGATQASSGRATTTAVSDHVSASDIQPPARSAAQRTQSMCSITDPR